MGLPVLHGLGALTAAGLSFGCDTGKAQQTARVPAYIEYLPGDPPHRYFLAAFPWDEGAEFVTHTWNPFALIFVFEWLTAAFALRPLKRVLAEPDALAQACVAWLFAGVGVFLGWTFTNSGGVCVAQLCTVLVSFLATGVVCVWDGLVVAPSNKYAAVPDPPDKEEEKFADEHGRLWRIPARIGGSADVGKKLGTSAYNYTEEISGVAWRYAEYCITAPLLFLAVVCLMVTDGPAWVFLTGYWLLIVCNALGIALHISFIFAVPLQPGEAGGLLPVITGVFFAGPWCALPCCFPSFSLCLTKKNWAGGAPRSTSPTCCWARGPACSCRWGAWCTSRGTSCSTRACPPWCSSSSGTSCSRTAPSGSSPRSCTRPGWAGRPCRSCSTSSTSSPSSRCPS
jgi:hypothetical protein